MRLDTSFSLPPLPVSSRPRSSVSPWQRAGEHDGSDKGRRDGMWSLFSFPPLSFPTLQAIPRAAKGRNHKETKVKGKGMWGCSSSLRLVATAYDKGLPLLHSCPYRRGKCIDEEGLGTYVLTHSLTNIPNPVSDERREEGYLSNSLQFTRLFVPHLCSLFPCHTLIPVLVSNPAN